MDFVGQTGVERSREEGQAMPGDYEAQVSQGPITVHAEERLATTDKGVALYRRMLRGAVRDLADGTEPPQLVAGSGRQGADHGRRRHRARASHEPRRRRAAAVMGREIGRIVRETMGLERAARRAEIERRVRGWLGARRADRGA